MKKMIAIVLALMLCVSALSVVAFAAEDTITVHVQMPEGAAQPSLWAWEGTNNAFSAWPGEKMTLNGDWYEIEVPNWVTGLIVSTNGNVDQTDDTTVEAGKDVWLVCVMGDDGKYDVASVSYDGGQTEEQPEEKPEVVIDAYYVAGTGALCNNKEWDPAAAENKMTKGEDGIWTITYTAVPAGEHKLKVTGGSWDNCWGAISNGDADGNIVFTLEEATDVVVKFNPANNKVTVLVNGEDMNPATGDMSLAAVSVALLAATAGLVAVVSKKKEF